MSNIIELHPKHSKQPEDAPYTRPPAELPRMLVVELEAEDDDGDLDVFEHEILASEVDVPDDVARAMHRAGFVSYNEARALNVGSLFDLLVKEFG